MKSKKGIVTKTRPTKLYLGKEGDAMYYASSSQAYNYEAMTPESALASYKAAALLRATSITGVPSTLVFNETIFTHTDRRSQMNNCTHSLTQCVNLPYLLASWKYNVYVWSAYSTEYIVRYYRRPHYPIVWADAGKVAAFHGVGVNDQGFSARAYWSMRPKIEGEVQALNSIFELKDFSDIASYMFKPTGLARFIKNNMRTLYQTFATMGQGHNMADSYLGRHLRAKTRRAYRNNIGAAKDWLSQPGVVMGDITKLSASAVLTWNLAVKPTIQDCMAWHAAAQTDVWKYLSDKKQMGEEGERSHFSERETLYSELTAGTLNNYTYATGKHISLTRTATMISKYRLLWQRFEDIYPKWWGLELGADEVWNMLPLSFVLDYIWTIGKSLEYMDREDNILVLGEDYCESVKVEAGLGYYIIQSYRTPQLVIDGRYIQRVSKDKPHLVSGTSGKYYERKIKEPYKGPALPKLKLPSPKQAVNLLALARCLIF